MRRGLGVGVVALIVLAAAALAFPALFTLPYHRDLAIRVLLYAMLAQAWNILAGYCGQVSLGHAVFFGTGAYTSSALQMYWGINPWVGLVAGVAVSVALSQAYRLPLFPPPRPLFRHCDHRRRRDHPHAGHQLGIHRRGARAHASH